MTDITATERETERMREQLTRERLMNTERWLRRELTERGMPEEMARDRAKESRERFTYDDDGEVLVALDSGGTVNGMAGLLALATAIRVAMPTDEPVMEEIIARKRATEDYGL